MTLFRILPVFVLVFLTSCFNMNKAGVTIPAQQQFVLGELEKEGFAVKLENKSKLNLEVETQDENGNRTSSFGLSPKGKTKISVGDNEKAIIKNPNATEVFVQAKLSRGVQGMAYEELAIEDVSNIYQIDLKYLEPIISDEWKGNLIYSDYSNGKEVQIPCNLKVTKKDENSLSFEYIYPGEPKANNKMKVKLKDEGRVIAGQRIISVNETGTQSIIKTIEEGKDNGEKALLHYTYTFSGSKFKMKKEYQKIGSDELVFRNEYRFTK